MFIVKTFECNLTYRFVQARVHKSESMNQSSYVTLMDNAQRSCHDPKKERILVK